MSPIQVVQVQEVASQMTKLKKLEEGSPWKDPLDGRLEAMVGQRMEILESQMKIFVIEQMQDLRKTMISELRSLFAST